MNNIPKKSIKTNVPKMVELTEQEVKKRAQAFRNSLKDEEGLVEAIEKNLKKIAKKDEFKHAD